MWRATRRKFPDGPSEGLKRWSFGPLNNNPLEYFTRIAREYGDIAGLRVLNFKTIFINHPGLIEEVLVTNARKYSKGKVLRANRHVFGEGLLTSEGDFWLRQRRLAQPAFHRARITSYAATMVDYTERMLQGWRGGESLELLLEIGANFRRTIFVPHWLPTPTNLRVRREVKQIEKILYRIIAERRASARDAGDLLSMLLSAQDEDGSRMTDRQLRDETITLFLAGHETTASTLSWTWWLLARHPEVEAKLHAELDAVLGDRAPTLDDLPKLRYTGQVITESLRLYPAAWGMARLAVEDHEIAGYAVTKGMGVAMAQWVVHRDPRWYDAPEEFRPERWEDDLLKRLPRFAYFPVGGGPRQCIGNAFALMEAALILATIAQKFRLRLVANHPVVPLASITLRPRHGVRISLESRQGRETGATFTGKQSAVAD